MFQPTERQQLPLVVVRVDGQHRRFLVGRRTPVGGAHSVDQWQPTATASGAVGRSAFTQHDVGYVQE